MSNSLDGSANGADNDGQVQSTRLPKGTSSFIAQSLLFSFGDTLYGLKELGILCDVCASLEKVRVFFQALFSGEGADISLKLFWCQMAQRVLDAVCMAIG